MGRTKMKVKIPQALKEELVASMHRRAIHQWYRGLASHVYRHFIRWISCIQLPPRTLVMRAQAKLCLKEVATSVLHMAVGMCYLGQAEKTKKAAVQVLLQRWKTADLPWPPTIDARMLHDFSGSGELFK